MVAEVAGVFAPSSRSNRNSNWSYDDRARGVDTVVAMFAVFVFAHSGWFRIEYDCIVDGVCFFFFDCFTVVVGYFIIRMIITFCFFVFYFFFIVVHVLTFFVRGRSIRRINRGRHRAHRKRSPQLRGARSVVATVARGAFADASAAAVELRERAHWHVGARRDRCLRSGLRISCAAAALDLSDHLSDRLAGRSCALLL
uniref:Uncharacterized protein n=1 Tax=Globisporangium ultimum (strain ATCC 200006 / CBS 805.95 / DAOM BR144) TaxID=431595 RepID=K3WB55_GLOUD